MTRWFICSICKRHKSSGSHEKCSKILQAQTAAAHAEKQKERDEKYRKNAVLYYKRWVK